VPDAPTPPVSDAHTPRLAKILAAVLAAGIIGWIALKAQRRTAPQSSIPAEPVVQPATKVDILGSPPADAPDAILEPVLMPSTKVGIINLQDEDPLAPEEPVLLPSSKAGILDLPEEEPPAPEVTETP